MYIIRLFDCNTGAHLFFIVNYKLYNNKCLIICFISLRDINLDVLKGTILYLLILEKGVILFFNNKMTPLPLVFLTLIILLT